MPPSVPAVARRVLRAPRETLGPVLWRVRHDPVWVALQVADAVPARRRTWLARRLLRVARAVLRRRADNAVAGVVAGFALVQLGRDARLDAFVADRRIVAGSRERVALARVLADADVPHLALGLLVGTPPTAAALDARGRARAAAGDLTAAAVDLRRGAELGSRAAAAELARVDATLQALSPAWSPSVPATVPGPTTPVPGRVLHVLNNSLPHTLAGYTVRTHRVAQAQRAAGLDPVMVTRPGYPVLQGVLDAAPADTVDGIAYHRLAATGVARGGPAALVQATVDRLAPLIARHRPAVLQPTSPYENARAAIALGGTTGLPVVYEVRGFLEETWRSRHGEAAAATDRYRLTRQVEGWCMRHADRVVTLGEAMRDDIVARGVDPARVWVVPNAVDADDFTPRPADPALRARLGFEPDEVVVGYVSSLVGYEGVAHLLEAIALLRGRGHRVRGLIVGDGTERAALEQRAADLGLATAVRFTGRVPLARVHDHYALLDVFVVPRTGARVCRTVTPLKPLEAMALERAVVVSDVPALRELIAPGTTGLVCPPEDPLALADTLEPLLDDPGTRAVLGKAAREWVLTERTWRRAGQRYRALLTELGAV